MALWWAAVRAIPFPEFQSLEYSLGMATSLAVARIRFHRGKIAVGDFPSGMSEGGTKSEGAEFPSGMSEGGTKSEARNRNQ
jgi:hypothetical protein